jgi:hypothetical protein
MGVPSRKGGQVSLGAFQFCRGKVGQALFVLRPYFRKNQR